MLKTWLALAGGLIVAPWLRAPAYGISTAEPPPGAVTFCLHNPSFCTAHDEVKAPLSALPLLARINALVNDSITPEALDTAEEKRAENRNWRVLAPEGLGSCADYAWTKYMLLAWSGVPMGAMRVAEVRLPGSQELHAVLLVRSEEDLLVLDNLTTAIRPAGQTS